MLMVSTSKSLTSTDLPSFLNRFKPEEIDWSSSNATIVIEATGLFTTIEKAKVLECAFSIGSYGWWGKKGDHHRTV